MLSWRGDAGQGFASLHLSGWHVVTQTSTAILQFNWLKGFVAADDFHLTEAHLVERGRRPWYISSVIL